MRRLVTLAAVALLIPASAQAAVIDWIPRWEAAAVSYWGHGQLPPCGTIHYVWADLGDAVGLADPAVCTVAFDKTYWNDTTALFIPERCMIDMHEIGHLYGRGHTTRGVMAASIELEPDWYRFKPCRDTMRNDRIHGRWVPR